MSKCVHFASRLPKHLAASSLLTEPKSRKVIVIEHPLLPVYVKEILAKILFENLQVLLPIILLLLLPNSRLTRSHPYPLLLATYSPFSPLAE
jgi:hypothetical protein